MIAAAPPAQPAAAVPVTCRRVDIKDAHPAVKDPTAFEDDPGIVLAPGRHVVIRDLKVVVRQGSRPVGDASLTRLPISGYVLRLRPAEAGRPVSVSSGDVSIRVTGTRAAACPRRRVDVTRTWRFGRASLPVRGAPLTPFVEDARKAGLQVALRSVGGRSARNVVATLLDGNRAIASRRVSGPLAGGSILSIPVPRSTAAGSYRLRVRGTVASARTETWTTPLFLGSRGAAGSPPVDQAAGLTEQRVVVNWTRNRAAHRDTAGFVVPGIGYGEIVCGFKQQHVRFYPTDLGREQSMMLWTYKDWQQNTEKSIRENVHTEFSGPSFQEGLNKFSPPEKHMTGEYEGLITDRGVLEAPFGSSLAPPTSIDLTWVWDFSDPRNSSCFVEATLRTENGDPTDSRPLARSLQVVWRGDDNAAGHDSAATTVPGVGDVSLVCQATPGGARTLTIDPATTGAAIRVREGGEDKLTEVDHGPVVAPLPNNGQLKIGMAGGVSMLVSSRWKVNDPNAQENSCRVAAQVVVR